MNRQRDRTSRRALVVFLLAVALVIAGCASGPQVPPPDGVDEMSPPEILYEAIVSTYESRQLPIDVSSQEFLIVTSEFQEVDPDLRRRMNTRVIRAAPGAMGLKVTAEWERKTTAEGSETWESVDNERLRERSEGDEIALARDIEKRFESWKREWKADQDE